jgi:predicted DNA-binding WGR domain protein
MTNDAVREALRAILVALQTNWKEGKELGAATVKKKDLKEAFAPIAAFFKWGPPADLLVQTALELPASAPLHVAARALVAEGAITSTPWVNITASAQPKRWVQGLLVDRTEARVYAIEEGLRISVWSLEDGAHLSDLTVPGKKAARGADKPGVHRLVQVEDGTLRALTSHGVIAECARGAKTFTQVMEIGGVRLGCAMRDDLGFIVNQLDFQPVEKDGTKHQRIAVHDVAARTSKEITNPFDYPSSQWLWEGEGALLGARRTFSTGPTENDWKTEYAIVRITGTGEVTTFAAPGEISNPVMIAPGKLYAQLMREDTEGSHYSTIELDLATQAFVEVPRMDSTSHTLWVRGGPEGLAYDRASQRILQADGTPVFGYAIPGGPHNRYAAWDAARGQLVLAGNDPEVPLTIIAPYSASRAEAAPSPVETAPLHWARAGVVLTYDIADFDAADTYRFEVLASDAGLALKIVMDESEVVAEHARFAEAALDAAKKQVSIQQGGADVDLTVEQTSTVPPILLPRASHKKLAAGKSAPWKSEWSEAKSLEPSSKGPVMITVDGAPHAVATLKAGADGAEVTVLNDARWPLVIERVEGDCHLRLVSIELAKATEAAAAPKAAPAKTIATPESEATGARHFEMVEGSSAKFWEVSVAGSALTTRFGKLGTAGQASTKDLGSIEAAEKEMAKLIREKTKKGYVEK